MSQAFYDLVTGKRRGLVPTLLRGMCAGAACPYAVAMAVRNRYYDQTTTAIQQVDIPVVSVGNLSVGGTGKTPMVAWLAGWFRQHQIRVAILSRGYGAEAGTLNDEAQELESLLPDVPHLQHPDRVRSARIAATELASQVLILDDGFQHRRLHRDLELVLLDATQPKVCQRLLPRGTFREPMSSLRRADVVVLTRCHLADPHDVACLRSQVLEIDPQLTVIHARHEPVELLSCSGRTARLTELNGKRLLAFCGIGHPEAFWQTLASQGGEVQRSYSFPDHHAYSAEDMSLLAREATAAGVDAVVCTHKDLTKVGVDQLDGIPLWACRVALQLEEPSALETHLHRIGERAAAHDGV